MGDIADLKSKSMIIN